MTTLHKLNALGQAVWFDFIRRSHTRSGQLQALIDQGVRGVTSNPSIFEKAIAGSDDYDADIRRLAAEGKSVVAIYEALAVEDIREAADRLRPLYDETEGRDGFVSLEVSPTLAHDTSGTLPMSTGWPRWWRAPISWSRFPPPPKASRPSPRRSAPEST